MSFSGLGGMLFLPFLALFVDGFRQKYLIAGAYLLYFLSGLLYLTSPADPRLYALPRMIQGAMITVTMISIVAALSHSMPPHERSRGIALFGVLGQLGAMAGVSVAELLLDSRGFPAMFLFASSALAAAGLAALLFPEAAPDGTERPPGIRDFAAILRQPSLHGIFFLSVLLGAGFGTMLSFLPDMVLERRVGIIKPYYLAYPAMVIAVRLGVSHWFRKIPLIPLVSIPMLMMPAALLIVAGLGSVAGLVAAGLSYGVAHGVLFPVLQAELINRVDGGYRARMALVFQFLFNAGIFLAANLGGLLADRSLRAAFLTVAAVTAAGAPIFILNQLCERRRGATASVRS
jgi:predicted MFS family arabinose efflux permease